MKKYRSFNYGPFAAKAARGQFILKKWANNVCPKDSCLSNDIGLSVKV